MKILAYVFLFLLVSINTLEATGYNLVLNDASSTIDGTTLSSTEVSGVTYVDGIVKITLEGTYILSGTLNGQIKVSSTGTVKLVLNGVTIKNTASNGILFTKAYELDSSTFNYNTAKVCGVTTLRIGPTASLMTLLAHNGKSPSPATQKIRHATAKRSSHVASVSSS